MARNLQSFFRRIMIIHQQRKWSTIFALLSLIVILSDPGCRRAPTVEEFLLGSWRRTSGKVHSILSFQTNGSWLIESRVEGKLSKIVAKRGKISGQWFYTDKMEDVLPEEVPDDKKKEKKAEEKAQKGADEKKETLFLVMSVTEAQDDESGWEVGSTKSFEFVQLDKEKLVLKSPDGTTVEWLRVRSDKNQEQLSEGLVTTKLGPLIVNLSRIKVQHKRRFLCLDVDLVIESSYVQADAGSPPPEIKLHPRVREAAIYYLSSKTYQDIRTVDKAQAISNELKDVLNPYVQNRIKELLIKQIVVTSERKVVEDYENKLLKPDDKANKEDKKDKNEEDDSLEKTADA